VPNPWVQARAGDLTTDYRLFTILLLNFQQKIELCGLLMNPKKHKLRIKTQLPAFPGSVHRNWGKGQKFENKITSFVLQQKLLLVSSQQPVFVW